MLGMMNSPNDGIDLYSAPNNTEPIFDSKGRKPQVTYMKDGRKLLNGEVEMAQQPDSMWNNLITKSVVRKIQLAKVNDQKEDAERKKECQMDGNGEKTTPKVKEAGNVDYNVQSEPIRSAPNLPEPSDYDLRL